MIAGILYAGVLGAGLKTEYLKSQQMELSEEVKSKIQEEGLYHVTSKESAMKIMESGFLLPTKGLVDNHFSKSRYGDGFADFVYMFAGKPTVEMYSNNLSHQVCKDGTIYAVRYRPNEYDINNYTERLEDGAITHEGILDIADSKPEIVRMTIEKGKLVEIPLDAEIKMNPFQKLFNNKVINFFKALPGATKELYKSTTFRDTTGKLKRSMAIRRDVNKMLKQYNNDSQMKDFSYEKDGESYGITTVGTKMIDGRPLSGFRISKGDGSLEKNVYMEALDITTIPTNDLGEFITSYMDREGVQSEYIGRLVKKEGHLGQEIDEGFMHNFNAKQLRAVKDNPVYAKYVERESKKKTLQLKKLQQTFKKVPSKARQEALDIVKLAREGKFMQKVQQVTMDLVKDENSGMVLGG